MGKTWKNSHPWWSYVRQIITLYPAYEAQLRELHCQSVTRKISDEPTGSGDGRQLERTALKQLPAGRQREHDAVEQALQWLDTQKNRDVVLQIIDMIFWKKSNTLEGAALSIGYSTRQCRRFQAEFITMVSLYMGFIEESELPSKKPKREQRCSVALSDQK